MDKEIIDKVSTHKFVGHKVEGVSNKNASESLKNQRNIAAPPCKDYNSKLSRVDLNQSGGVTSKMF